MQEPWELKSDDSREENSINTFIIFCEDENDEPFYFRSFQIEGKLKVNAITNQGKSKINLNNTISKCVKDGLIECVDNAFMVKQGITENIWCVYDRDLETVDLTQIKNIDDTNFTTSIQTANAAGIKVAWSNDAFELWILLHFEQVPVGNRLHRTYIYDRLSDIFKQLDSKSLELKDITQHHSFNYKSRMKRKATFLNHVLPLIKKYTSTAIANAYNLEAAYNGSIPYHDCNPCTKIHYLVSELISAQQ